MTSRRAAAASVVAGAATWGTTGTAQALADLDVAPALVGAARITGGAAALVVLALLTRRGILGRLGGAPRGALAVAGAAAALYQVTFFAGVDRAGVAVGTVVGIGSVPVLTGLVAWLADRVVPARRWWGATALAVLGCVLVVGPGADVAIDRLGVLLALGAGLSYSVLVVAQRRLLDAGLGPVEALAATFTVGALPGVALLVGGDPSGLVSADGLALVLWLALVTVALGYALWARGLAVLPAPTVGTLTLTEPLVAAALGVALLGERPTPAAIVGAGLLAAGLVLVSLPAGDRRVGVEAT